MISSEILQNEISTLQNLNFLLPTDTLDNIKLNLHNNNIWADVFWRRRDRHKVRLDPEIPFIFDNNQQTILEIGAGYGRVLKKIIEFAHSNDKSKAEITGIDICSYFQPYFEKYSVNYPILHQVKMYYDDFFITSKLKNHYYDVILLPMNSFPSFPISLLDKLFNSVEQFLKPNGSFVFSTYKLPTDNSKIGIVEESHGGELLVELGKHKIVLEYYSFAGKKTNYGVQAVTYHIYSILTQDYQLINRELYRTVREFIQPDNLQEMINNYGFKIQKIDKESHSAVYILSKK